MQTSTYPNNVTTTIQKSTLEDAILNGLHFLEGIQLSSGQFPTEMSSTPDMHETSSVKTVAATAIVIDCLIPLRPSLHHTQMIDNGIRFLKDEMDQDGMWRFFGKGSSIYPDLDDTCFILSVLRQCMVSMDYCDYVKNFLNFRDFQGRFYTWHPLYRQDNNIDWVTNTNVLYFYLQMGVKVPEVTEYLQEVILSNEFIEGSLYYQNPLYFSYFWSRLVAENTSMRHSAATRHMTDVLAARYTSMPRRLQFESVLLFCSLVELGADQLLLDELALEVLHLQSWDGGWVNGSIFNHRTFSRYYGGRPVFTAIAVLALDKYIQLRKREKS